MRTLAVSLFFIAASTAQVRVARFENRAAWRIDGAHLRVTVLQTGGHIAEIVLKESGVNPLWIQSRPTIETDQYVAAEHQKLYDDGPGARLMSGIMGHSLCFPFWGDPSPAEYAAGMTYHGETGISRWTQLGGAKGALTLVAELPESRTRFTRSIRLAEQVVWFEETAENESAWDRPVGWCEHVTLGPPFLGGEVTVIEASLTRGEAYGRELAWPMGADENGVVDLHRVRRDGPVLVNHFLVDPTREWGFFAAFDPGHRLLFGYAFPRADFPWLNVWESNTPQILTRGMEFSNTPVHGTMKVLVKTPSVFGVPAFEWLDAKSKLRKRYCAFSVTVPADYQGVADVIVRGQELTIVEKGSGSRLTVR